MTARDAGARTWFGGFVNPDRERAFRASRADEALRAARLFVIVHAGIVVLLMLVQDGLLLSGSHLSLLPSAIAARMILPVWALVLVVASRRTRLSPDAIDGIVAITAGVAALSLGTITVLYDAVLPDAQFLFWFIIQALAVPASLSVPTRVSAVAMVAVLSVPLAIRAGFLPTTGTALFLEAMSVAVVFASGVTIAVQRNHAARADDDRLQRERQLRDELEKLLGGERDPAPVSEGSPDILQQLLHAQRMHTLGKLSSSIAHDINNLLVPILGFAEMAEQHGSRQELDESLREIRAAVGRARDVTGQLLALARRQPSSPETLDPNAWLRDLEGLLGRALPDNVTLHVDAEAEGRVVGDPSQLAQVLLNLVVNARDAMPDGGVVSVHAWTTPPNTHLAVRDEGPGIPAEVQAHMFEPFFTTKGDSGTGLGLAVVQNIVHRHGGQLEVTSVENEGTEVQVILPTVAGTPATPQAQATTGSLAGLTLLVVDDDVSVLSIVSLILSRAGARVLEASGADDALHYVANEALPDVLVTDLHLDGTDGLALMDTLRARAPELPVVVISGVPQADRKLVPPARWLAKPFTPEQLRDAVGSLIQVA